MREKTEDLLHELKAVPWFRSVGMKLDDASISRVDTWSKALKGCQSEKWQAVQVQASNWTKIQLNTQYFERYEVWNTVLREVKSRLTADIMPLVEGVSQKNRLSKHFNNSVMWDLFSACMETEYEDVVAPVFFLKRVLPFYKIGRFPCGWDGDMISDHFEGDWPDGRIMVF